MMVCLWLSANIRSAGYSDLFSLSKDDLWETLEEYPDARKALLDKGREILMKDNMIDEEMAAKEASDREALEQSVEKLDDRFKDLSNSLASMIAEFSSFEIKMKKRLTTVEAKSGLIKENPEEKK